MRIRIAAAVLLLSSTLVAIPAVAQEPTCKKPKLSFSELQQVTLGTFITWSPPSCPMVIETWRADTDCKKIGVTDAKGWDHTKPRACDDEGLRDVGVTSGTVTIGQIRGDQKGLIAVKLWPRGADATPPVKVNVR